MEVFVLQDFFSVGNRRPSKYGLGTRTYAPVLPLTLGSIGDVEVLGQLESGVGQVL